MKIAVLSGKGGAGKTFAAVNLAVAAGRSVYVDCDVEEPNGRLFLNPEAVVSSAVSVPVPEFNTEKCTGCRKCVDFCRFNALVFLNGEPRVFTEICHSCGGCRLVCPADAVREKMRPVGQLEQGCHGQTRVVTGILNPGEASGIPVIKAAIKAGAPKDGEPAVLDCPPGSACSVIESVSSADYCLIVAEPTVFGFHNFRMAHNLAVQLGKSCGVLINKQETRYEPLENFCLEKHLPILAVIPYSTKIAALMARGVIAYDRDADLAAVFAGILKKITEAAA